MFGDKTDEIDYLMHSSGDKRFVYADLRIRRKLHTRFQHNPLYVIVQIYWIHNSQSIR